MASNARETADRSIADCGLQIADLRNSKGRESIRQVAPLRKRGVMDPPIGGALPCGSDRLRRVSHRVLNPPLPLGGDCPHARRIPP